MTASPAPAAGLADDAPASQASRRAAPAIASAPPPVPSTTLLQGRSVVQIEHNGALYQLRNTRLGKLILTK